MSGSLPYIPNLRPLLAKGYRATKNLGEGLATFLVGSHRVNGKYDWLHGVKNFGKPQAVHTEGVLKGLRKYDSQGVPVYEDKRNLPRFLHQELFKGDRPARGDFYLSMHSKRAPGAPNVGSFAEELQKASLNPHKATPEMQKHLENLKNINSLSRLDFIRKNPELAARYYGAKAIFHGFGWGLPAMELYSTLVNKEGSDPSLGAGGNVGATLGSNLGGLLGMRKGILGGIASSMIGEYLGKKGGGLVDSALGNKPLSNPSINYPYLPKQGNPYQQHPERLINPDSQV